MEVVALAIAGSITGIVLGTISGTLLIIDRWNRLKITRLKYNKCNNGVPELSEDSTRTVLMLSYPDG